VKLTALPPSCAVVMKSGNLNFLEPSGPFQDRNGTALHEDICIFTIISHRILLKTGNISGEFVGKFETHILRSIFFFLENRAVYEIMWKVTVEPDRSQ
jgi:hypothetical protein